jgi:FixJ family two-component response regulator
VSTTNRPILLATNDPNDIFAFWRYHKECGVQNPVELFQDGEDVFRYLAHPHPGRLPPALLILSLQMPHVGGMRVLEYFKWTRQNGFPIVLLIPGEAHTVPLAVAAYRFGVERFLTRPIEKNEFCNVISQFPAITQACCDLPILTKPVTTTAAPTASR